MPSNLSHLIDRYEGYLGRKGRTRRTRDSYRWTLWKFVDAYPNKDARDITKEDCERFLDRWIDNEPATLAQRMAALGGFFKWLADEGLIDEDPMAKVPRPKRKQPEMLPVVTVSTEDVRRMFEFVETWNEVICLSLVASTGARRTAAAQLRWRDIDMARRLITFVWKGGGTHVMQMTDELFEILTQAVSEHEVDTRPDAYVVANDRPGAVRLTVRDDRIVWKIIRRIAKRAGVRAHVHALRGAFAVMTIEELGLDLLDLKQVMGHRRAETTMVYLRRLDRQKAMESIRSLSWGHSALSSFGLKAHTGFEPVLPA